MEQVDEDREASDRRDDEAQFLAVIESRAALPRHVRPGTAAVVAMCTLAERLTPGQAHLLFEALPPPIQLLLDVCMVRSGRPVAKLDDAAFLEQIAQRLEVTPAHAELIAHAVYGAIRALIPETQVDHVAAQLPKDLRDLWLGTRLPIIMDTDTANEAAAPQALLTEIADRAPLPIGVTVPDALAAVMCIFSRRLSGGEARDVLLGLPRDVRPLIERCFVRREEAAETFDRAQLVRSVADQLNTTAPLAEQIVHAVFAAIKRFLPAKEQADVASQLPPDLRDTWVSA